jgi:alkylation response protein AidB-like acyl-CoA dehydrogenase
MPIEPPATQENQSKYYKSSFADDADRIEADLIEKIIALRPLLRSEAMAAERQRSMTDRVFKELSALNIWWMILPRRWGGMGLPSSAMGRVNREIAKGDPSVAWVVQIFNGTGWISSMTPDPLQQELFNSGPTCICSSFSTVGTARPVAGGYIINGEWTYNSGSRQANWGQYLVNIEHPDGRVVPGNFAYVKMEDVDIVDTWYCAGLQGTSSDSARVADLFIPEHMMLLADKPAGAHSDQVYFGEPCDYWPIMPLIRSAGLGLILGAAEGALEFALETAGKRSIPNTLYAKQSDSPVLQRNLGEAASKINAARLLALDAAESLDRYALNREEPSITARAVTRAHAATAVKLLTQAVDAIMFGAGSSAFLLSNPLQRYWRDINVAARHAIYNAEVGYEVFGCDILGVEQTSVLPMHI